MCTYIYIHMYLYIYMQLTFDVNVYYIIYIYHAHNIVYILIHMYSPPGVKSKKLVSVWTSGTGPLQLSKYSWLENKSLDPLVHFQNRKSGNQKSPSLKKAKQRCLEDDVRLY